MSVRLTDIMRSRITAALMRHRFDKEEAALRKRQHDLTMKMHRLRYSPADRKRMSGMPDGWLPVANRFTVDLGQVRFVLHATEYFPIPTCDQGRNFRLGEHKEGKAAGEAVLDFVAARDALSRTMEDMRKTTTATLSGFSTLNRLLEAWPEVKPFTDKLGYDADKKALPAVIPTGLNTNLGLPVSGKP